MMMLWLSLPQHINGSTYPDVIHNKNKLSHIAIWGLLFTNVMLNESLYIMFWAVTIASIESVNCYAYDGRNQIFYIFTKSTNNYLFFPWNLPTTRCIFSAAWCHKRSLLYDQSIEDINIFSPAFWLSWGGWLNLPGGSTYPTLPYKIIYRKPL